MTRPYGLLRCGYPYVKTLGMRRLTNFPMDITIGNEDRIYIISRQESGVAVIKRYSVDDKDLGSIGEYGSGEGQLKWPVSLTTDTDENIFVSDEGTHRITIYNLDGEYISSWGTKGSDPGYLNGPAGIAFDSEQNLYIADSKNHRIQKVTKRGKHIDSWGSFGDGAGQFNLPYGIAVDEEDFVYVTDWRNDRVQKFTGEGEFVFEFGNFGRRDGEFNRPCGITVDSDGDIYIADWRNDRVQMFDFKGSYVQKFLGDASLSKVAREYMLTNASPNRMRDMANLEPQKLLRRPRSVAIDSDKMLYIADNESYRIQVYRKEVIPLTSSELAPPFRAPTLSQE